MGIVQDTLVGGMLFTQRDSFLTRDVVMNLLLHVGGWNSEIPMPAILKPEPLWTGKQLFSLIMPPVNLVRFSDGHEDDGSEISYGDTKVYMLYWRAVVAQIARSMRISPHRAIVFLCSFGRFWSKMGR